MAGGRYFDMLETYKQVRNGEERTGWKKVGVAFPLKEKGGFKLVPWGVVTIVPGVNDLLLMPHEDKAQQGATDFPPRQDQPMEGEEGGYPSDNS